MLFCWWNFALIFFSRCFSTDLRVYQKSDKFWETYKSENRARSGIPSATYLLSQFQNRKAGYPSWNVGVLHCRTLQADTWGHAIMMILARRRIPTMTNSHDVHDDGGRNLSETKFYHWWWFWWLIILLLLPWLFMDELVKIALEFRGRMLWGCDWQEEREMEKFTRDKEDKIILGFTGFCFFVSYWCCKLCFLAHEL